MSNTRGRRRVRALSKRASPKPGALMRPANSIAPVALTLAWARNWLAPALRATRLAPSGLPSAAISTVASAARGDSSVISTGKRSPLKTCAGMLTDSRTRLGRGCPASGMTSIGTPRCWACQIARVTLPRFSLPSEIRRTRGTRPAGKVASPSRMAASRFVPCEAWRVLCASFQTCPVRSAGVGLRGARANGSTCVQLRPRPRSTAVAAAEAASKSCWETLAEVSTRMASATLDS